MCGECSLNTSYFNIKIINNIIKRDYQEIDRMGLLKTDVLSPKGRHALTLRGMREGRDSSWKDGTYSLDGIKFKVLVELSVTVVQVIVKSFRV